MDKAIRQTQQELNQFLKQQHISLDELFTYFPNQLFPEIAPVSLTWDPFYREDIELDYLPDPQGSEDKNSSDSQFSALQLSQILKTSVHPFVFYLLIKKVSPLAKGLYRYREQEHALEFLSEPSAKLLEKIPELRVQVPLLFLVSLPRKEAEASLGQRYLLPALIQLGQKIEYYSREAPLTIRYSFDGNEILKRLEIPDPILLILEFGKMLDLDNNNETEEK